MSALVIGLLILAVICFGYLAVEAHRKDMAALDAKWQAVHDEAIGDWADLWHETHQEWMAEQDAHNATRERLADALGELEWSRITAATLIAPDMRPTILAAHRDLAPVVPIGGRG